MAPALRSPSLGPPPRPRPPAEALRGVARSQRARGPGPPAMGSSSSRQPAKGAKGLLGRRTQSSGSLCTADKLGRLLAPCGRHRNHQEDHRHHRYKLCGSLPNHLDVAQEDGDNNNVISPASPAASEKGRVLEMQDLGYASERSPDEEKHFPGDISGTCECVPLTRTSRGLGLSVCGGADCSADGLVRIKRLFPHQPAWQSGRLRPGDVLLAVNGTPLSGLTNHDALEVLRTAPDHVVLTVARPSRPPSWVAPTPLNLCGVPPCQPRQPRREPAPSLQPPDPRTVLRQDSCGELELTLSKVQGSLGFTLRKEDSSALGHYVRALVREPALSDGRIRPGDKIVAVNGVDICHMSHEEAVMFLRQAGDSVVLRLYRDIAQTPVSALSPTETHKTFRPKPLRKEALDMLSDLAVRRMAPRPGESSTLGRPRKISDGRGGGGGGGGVGGGVSAASSASSQRARTRSFGEQQAHRSQELIASSRSSHGRGRGREESPLVDLVDSTVSSSSLSSLSSCANSVVERPRARRPDFLELSSGGKHPHPQPSSIHAPQWHLQRLTTSPGPGPDAAATWADDGRASDFASLPCDAGSPEHEGRRGTSSHFSHRNPAYQSAHPACRGGGPASGGGKRGDGGMAGDGAASGRQSVLDSRPGTRLPPQDSAQDTRAGDGCTGLLKWKGVVFTPEDDADTVSSTPPDQDTEDDTASQSTLEDNTGQVFTVELNRGWNSRLGFSLQNDGIHSVISAIYNDSVAAKNGRLRTGDRVIMVNDESVEGMETTDVIDLFRKIRGPIAITVWRQNDL